MIRRSILKAATAACFLPLLTGCVSTKPTPATRLDGVGQSGDLSIRLYAVQDLEAFRLEWDGATEAPEDPGEDLVLFGGTVHLPVLFHGCGSEEGGSCELYGRLIITNEKSGELVYSGRRVKLWANSEAANPEIWSMATHVPNLTVTEGGAPMRVVFEVVDEVRKESVSAALVLRTKGAEESSESAK